MLNVAGDISRFESADVILAEILQSQPGLDPEFFMSYYMDLIEAVRTRGTGGELYEVAICKQDIPNGCVVPHPPGYERTLEVTIEIDGCSYVPTYVSGHRLRRNEQVKGCCLYDRHRNGSWIQVTETNNGFGISSDIHDYPQARLVLTYRKYATSADGFVFIDRVDKEGLNWYILWRDAIRRNHATTSFSLSQVQYYEEQMAAAFRRSRSARFSRMLNPDELNQLLAMYNDPYYVKQNEYTRLAMAKSFARYNPTRPGYFGLSQPTLPLWNRNTCTITDLSTGESRDASSDDCSCTVITGTNGTEEQIQQLQQAVVALQADVTLNTADIAANTAAIAANAANIATNTSNIATNNSDIATNAADIAALKQSENPIGTLAEPADDDTIDWPNARKAGTIVSLTLETTSGTVDVTVTINGTPVTFGLATAVQANDTQPTYTATADNTFAAGDDIRLELSNNSSAQNMAGNLYIDFD